MKERLRLGVTEALFLKPLLEGLDAPESQFGLFADLPASLAVAFSDRPENLRGAFLSPIDYARHGGDYEIVPGISVSSSQPTGTIQLFVKEGIKDISRLAVDVRVTSEIILAKILLLEKFTNLSEHARAIQFLPMMPNLESMLKKADAALVTNLTPPPAGQGDVFWLDLVEEWNDLTGLPYVHGFWVVRGGGWNDSESKELLAAKERGVKNLSSIARRGASVLSLPEERCLSYLSSFSYDLGEEQEAGLSEFLRFSYFHGALGDIPDLNFYSGEES